MNAKFRYAGVGLALLGLAVSAAGCRKDLCYDHDAHSPGCRALVTAVWEREWERDYGLGWLAGWDAAAYGRAYDDLRPDAAEGIAMVVYGDPESRTAVSDEFHLSAGGGKVSLKEGSYSLLFYNDDTEFIVFNDMASLPSASATTRTRTRGSYSEHHAEERTVNTPDMLYGHFVERYGAEMHLGWEELPVKMQPFVYTYLVRYRVEYGRQHIALARGALAGMAESVYLQDGRTGDEAATLLYDCTLTADGAEACVLSFGVPSFPDSHYEPTKAEEGGRRYGLNLEVMLNNGKLVTFDFDITSQMERQPRGGVIEVDGIRISDEDAAEGGSAFDPDVDGWGDYEDVEIPL